MTTKQTIAGLCTVAVLSAGLSGCSTVAVHLDKDIEPGPYYGTKHAIKETKRSWNQPRFYGEATFVVWDIPLSFAADTLLLPVAVARRQPPEN